MRGFSILALAAALAACAAPPVAGIPAPAEKAQVVFHDHTGQRATPGNLVVRFNDGSGERVVTSRQMELEVQDPARPGPPLFATRSSGTLHISVTYSRRGRQVASGAVDLPLKPDWIYGVDFMVKAGNPTEGCFGCMGSRSFPLAGATAGEQFHIVWGGNSISSPAVY